MKLNINFLVNRFPAITLFTLIGLYSVQASGAPVPSGQDRAISDQQLINQQERQKAIEQNLSSQAPDISLLPGINSMQVLDFPTEAPCFVINKVKLINREALSYIMPLHQLSDQAEGRCLGGEGINLLMSELQNRLIILN